MGKGSHGSFSFFAPLSQASFKSVGGSKPATSDQGCYYMSRKVGERYIKAINLGHK